MKRYLWFARTPTTLLMITPASCRMALLIWLRGLGLRPILCLRVPRALAHLYMNPETWLHLWRSLNDTLACHLPLMSALTLMVEQTTTLPQRSFCLMVHRLLSHGTAVNRALISVTALPDWLSGLLKQLPPSVSIAAIAPILAEHYAHVLALRKRLYQQLTYPCFLILSSLAFATLIHIYWLPRFQGFWATLSDVPHPVTLQAFPRAPPFATFLAIAATITLCVAAWRRDITPVRKARERFSLQKKWQALRLWQTLTELHLPLQVFLDVLLATQTPFARRHCVAPLRAVEQGTDQAAVIQKLSFLSAQEQAQVSCAYLQGGSLSEVLGTLSDQVERKLARQTNLLAKLAQATALALSACTILHALRCFYAPMNQLLVAL